VSEHEIKLDLARAGRTGLEEAIFCAHKSSDQIEVVLDQIHAERKSCLLTRLGPERYSTISPAYRSMIDYDEMSGTAFFGWREKSLDDPQVAIVTAGSSDIPVAREAMRTLSYFHMDALPIFDVGVAGLWRLLERIDDIRRCPVVIAAAGMDAALPSVLGGLYAGLIVAIPTSVGYGVAAGGTTALNAILSSCASGIVTVNIDNGYGAACAALRALRPQQRQSASTAHDPRQARTDTKSDPR
jgi:pyridinium-3,5-biscarboxylic acid mononucleotide synthase